MSYVPYNPLKELFINNPSSITEVSVLAGSGATPGSIAGPALIIGGVIATNSAVEISTDEGVSWNNLTYQGTVFGKDDGSRIGGTAIEPIYIPDGLTFQIRSTSGWWHILYKVEE